MGRIFRRATCCEPSRPDFGNGRPTFDICVRELTELIQGRLQFGWMPPLHGEQEIVHRIVTVDQVRKGDVAILDAKSPGQAFRLSQEAFHRGALGLITQIPCVPWDGRFSVTVPDVELACRRLAQYRVQNYNGSIVAVSNGARTRELCGLIARGLAAMGERPLTLDSVEREAEEKFLSTQAAESRWLVADSRALERLCTPGPLPQCCYFILGPQARSPVDQIYRNFGPMLSGGCLIVPAPICHSSSRKGAGARTAIHAYKLHADFVTYGTKATAHVRAIGRGAHNIELAASDGSVLVTGNSPGPLRELAAACALWRMVFSKIDLVGTIVHRVISRSSAETMYRPAVRGRIHEENTEAQCDGSTVYFG